MDKDLEVIEQGSWGNGCVYGNHCGSGCGDGQKYGGGKTKDATDMCCRNHDICWSRFGAWSPCCDKTLLNCLSGKNNYVEKGAKIFFGNNAKKCK